MMNEIPKAFYSTTLETSSLILEKIATLLYKIINLTTACQDREICDALRDLLPFVQFKKREKHPWRNVTFSKVAD